MQEILRKLQKKEISIRKSLSSKMHGDRKSMFRGSGLEFADLRPYQYGDDTRSINWSATAKGHDTYVNLMQEEKEQQVLLMVDISASQDIGKSQQKKIDLAREIAGVLALAALKDQQHIGLLLFSDKKEKYLRPDKGPKRVYQIISTLYAEAPKAATSIQKAAVMAMESLNRKSLVIIISDFLDEDYMHSLKSLASKHKMAAIRVCETTEMQLPGMGIIPVMDREKQQVQWINTSSKKYRKSVEEGNRKTAEALQNLCRAAKAGYTEVFTGQDYVPQLVTLFRTL